MLARLTVKTSNRKLTRDPNGRPVSQTSAAQASCPTECPFYGNGCYAESGPQGIHTRRLNAGADNVPPDVIAADEAEAIYSQWPRDGRLLRVHVVGDCRTWYAARLVSDAVDVAQSEGAGDAFGYTHAFARVPRSAWGPVSVLASVETPDDVRLANQNGYAPAIVAESRAAGMQRLAAAGVRGIGCPAEDGNADCESCRLCTRADTLRDSGRGIVFVAHGSGTRKVSAAVAAKNA